MWVLDFFKQDHYKYIKLQAVLMVGRKKQLGQKNKKLVK